MRFDAEASMRCWGVTLSIGGRDYRIPPHPAGPWLKAIVTPSYRAIVPGMITGLSMDDLLDQMVARRVTVADLDRAAREAIGEIAGMKWWSAVRLTSWLLGNWHTLGSAVLSRGLSMSVDPLGAVLVVTYRVILENCKDEQERQKVDMELDLAPRGVSAEEMFDPVAAGAAFMALASAPDGA